MSHDLAQPLNAAHLFVHALSPQLSEPGHQAALANIDGALGSAESLLGGLLDISRLDAGGISLNDGSLTAIARGVATSPHA